MAAVPTGAARAHVCAKPLGACTHNASLHSEAQHLPSRLPPVSALVSARRLSLPLLPMAEIPTMTVMVGTTVTTGLPTTVTTTSYFSVGRNDISTTTSTNTYSRTTTVYTTVLVTGARRLQGLSGARWVAPFVVLLLFTVLFSFLFTRLVRRYKDLKEERRMWQRMGVPMIHVVHPQPAIVTQVHVEGLNVYGVGGGGGGGGGQGYGAGYGYRPDTTVPPPYGH